MKILIDENLPVKLKYRFLDQGINAFTVRDMNWLGKSNSELLKNMLDNNFSTFLTIDNNVAFQNNFSNYPIQVIVILANDNTYLTVMEVFSKIVDTLLNPVVNITSIIHPDFDQYK